MTSSTQPSSDFSKWKQYLTVGLIILGVLLICFFGLRMVRSHIRLQQTGLQPGVVDVELVRGWMTVPYIARAYATPKEYIFEQIHIPPEGNEHKSISQLNREFAPGKQGEIINRVKEALRRYLARHPHPLPPPEARHD